MRNFRFFVECLARQCPLARPPPSTKEEGRRGNVPIGEQIGLLPRRVEYTQLFATLLSVAYDREFSDIANSGAIQFGHKGRQCFH